MRASRAYNCTVRNNAISWMSTTAITDLAAVCAGVFGLALYVGLILVPAWNSYSRAWERLAATVLSLYVLAVFAGAGVLGALLAVYFWG
jgi:hypothetical protein